MSIGADNYDDVMKQLRGGGLLVESIEVGRLMRCKVEGHRERRGWYALHEIRLDNGKLALVGAFGQWHGAEKNTQKIELHKTDLSAEQRAAIRARITEDRRREDARRKREAQRAAMRARNGWAKCSATWTPPGGEPIASNDYLLRKQVRAHGVRFSSRGNLVIPLTDTHGNVHALQVIYHEAAVKKRKGRDKDYWPVGVETRGRFFLIGSPGPIILIAEGYATAASLHEATGLPVAIAFAANNIMPVAQAIHERYRSAHLLICADDDWLGTCKACLKLTLTADDKCTHCGADTTKLQNAGVLSSSAAALAVSGAWVAPVFGDRGMRKLTDFNDLAAETTSATVRVQIEDKLRELAWSTQAPAPPPTTRGVGIALRAITSSQELFERFAVVYGHSKSLFDYQERMLLPAEDVKLACSGRDVWKMWQESHDKKVVRINEVGFDPSEQDKTITCNLWGGWPTQPVQGQHELLLELLEHLCATENNAKGIYDWIVKWLAYPIQNPGAKMKTAIVVHGPQRVGKNFFFESVAEIYGQYGEVIDQDALEDKYNDCFSKKLFLIADEVIARAELYHVKNKLKSMITGKRIRINPKNVKSYWEGNHCNIVFLSNETQPLVLERDDGRHVVLWTPPKLSQQFYLDVQNAVANGAIAALHYHLKYEVDLTGFTPHTPPPMTVAKRELMDLSMDSTERFWLDWTGGKIDPVPAIPAKSTALYALYREWCGRCGYSRYAPEPRFLAEIGKRTDATKQVRRYLNGAGTKQATFVFPPGVEPPIDKGEPVWLSDCIEVFTAAVKSWRDDAH